MAATNIELNLVAIKSQIEKCFGLEKMKKLKNWQNPRNEDTSKLAFEIIDRYFRDEVR
jgi:hypothetical protein